MIENESCGIINRSVDARSAEGRKIHPSFSPDTPPLIPFLPFLYPRIPPLTSSHRIYALFITNSKHPILRQSTRLSPYPMDRRSIRFVSIIRDVYTPEPGSLQLSKRNPRSRSILPSQETSHRLASGRRWIFVEA